MKIDDQKTVSKVWNIKKQVLLGCFRKGKEAEWVEGNINYTDFLQTYLEACGI